ncbi:MAG: hypothetical protein L6R36_007928 [Xanthoria steineri]|nr:MAG: hypothetical protein L6R36_007928 [Xanthoria steineri]
MILSPFFIALAYLASNTLAVPTTGPTSANSTNVTAEHIAVNATAIAPHASITARQWNIGFPDLGHPVCFTGGDIAPNEFMLAKSVEKAADYVYFDAPEVPKHVTAHGRHFQTYWRDEDVNVQVCVSVRNRGKKGLDVYPVDVGDAMKKIYDLCCWRRGKSTCGAGIQQGMVPTREKINVLLTSVTGDGCSN